MTTTTTTPEQADILPAEAIDLDALGELAKRLRREATAFDNDLGSDPEADAGTARLLREAAGAIDLVRRADDHYFAVDYTGCIHEAPDRETAIKWAEDFARTANGGAIGSERPEVAAAIGSLARRAAVPSEQKPVAWRIRERPGFPWAFSDYDPERMPNVCGWEREPLYTHPAPAAGVKVKPLKWEYFHAIGADTPEEWFASTPEGQSLTVTYDESCELPWVARPFPPGPSNYATADEAKAALEAAREARIRRGLDTGEPK